MQTPSLAPSWARGTTFTERLPSSPRSPRTPGQKARAQQEASSPNLPNGWKRSEDSLGRVYYYNKQTMQRAWRLPATDSPVSATRTPVSHSRSHLRALEPEPEPEPDPPAPREGVAMLQLYKRRNILGPDPAPQFDPVFHEMRLEVEGAGHFGAVIDEVVVKAPGKSPRGVRRYFCVTEVTTGSEAARKLPELSTGAFLLSAIGLCPGKMDTLVLVEALQRRPVSLVFVWESAAVDRATQRRTPVTPVRSVQVTAHDGRAANAIPSRAIYAAGPRAAGAMLQVGSAAHIPECT
jgi:hypothetical protein